MSKKKNIMAMTLLC